MIRLVNANFGILALSFIVTLQSACVSTDRRAVVRPSQPSTNVAMTTRPTSATTRALPHVPGDPVVLPVTREIAPGVQLGYPADFLDGRLAPVAADPHDFFRDAFVIVERARA